MNRATTKIQFNMIYDFSVVVSALDTFCERVRCNFFDKLSTVNMQSEIEYVKKWMDDFRQNGFAQFI